jgi:hypothetical protein
MEGLWKRHVLLELTNLLLNYKRTSKYKASTRNSASERKAQPKTACLAAHRLSACLLAQNGRVKGKTPNSGIPSPQGH